MRAQGGETCTRRVKRTRSFLWQGSGEDDRLAGDILWPDAGAEKSWLQHFATGARRPRETLTTSSNKEKRTPCSGGQEVVQHYC